MLDYEQLERDVDRQLRQAELKLLAMVLVVIGLFGIIGWLVGGFILTGLKSWL